jgi:hypothetical protein
MGQMVNAYKILIGKPEGKRSLERPGHKWEAIIKFYLTEIGYEDVNWVQSSDGLL